MLICKVQACYDFRLPFIVIVSFLGDAGDVGRLSFLFRLCLGGTGVVGRLSSYSFFSVATPVLPVAYHLSCFVLGDAGVAVRLSSLFFLGDTGVAGRLSS